MKVIHMRTCAATYAKYAWFFLSGPSVTLLVFLQFRLTWNWKSATILVYVRTQVRRIHTPARLGQKLDVHRTSGIFFCSYDGPGGYGVRVPSVSGVRCAMPANVCVKKCATARLVGRVGRSIHKKCMCENASTTVQTSCLTFHPQIHTRSSDLCECVSRVGTCFARWCIL